MIGHYAVGVNREGVGEYLGSQVVEEPFGVGWVEKDFSSVFAAEGEEEPAGANVAVEREADVFVEEHAWWWWGL